MPNPLKERKQTNPFELHPERLATTTQSGQRIYLYPAFLKGHYRTLRTAVYWVLLVIFLGLPWIKIHHHSAILIDIVHRKFAFFGLTFWGHDVPILFLVLAIGVLSLGFLTALLGRVWCGWMCPQTVFIDLIFRKIEVLIEGTPNDRRKLDLSPLTAKKLFKRGLKWTLFGLCSFVITHSFLAYLTGTENLAHIITSPPSQHPSAFIFMLIANLVILFNFGWFREQFCIIACPYGRFQSVFMDPNSLVVGYDARRDDDCIDCHRCVQVCPTGVDIRRGVQMECIMCTACIDACDQVMTKIQKPKNLVGYTTENELNNQPTQWFRPRIIVYILLILAAVGSLAVIIKDRDLVPIFARTSKESPYQLQADGRVTNPITFSVHNQFFEPITISLSPSTSDPNFKLITWITPTPKLELPSGHTAQVIVFVQFPKGILVNGKRTLKILKTIAHPHHGQQTRIEEITLVGPML